MIKAVIFDFDGVIHDTFDFNLKWLNHFVNDNFKPLTNQEFRDLHNGNSYNLRIKNPKLKDINYVEYRKVTAKARGEFQIEPQIFKEIKNLEEKFQLFIVSSAGEQGIINYLNNNNIINSFKEIIGAETHSSKEVKLQTVLNKYNLSNNTLFITDTTGDILEAHKVNIKTLAVDFGFHSKDHLQTAKPHKIISCLSEINQIIKELNNS